jgi:hypothetical protein
MPEKSTINGEIYQSGGSPLVFITISRLDPIIVRVCNIVVTYIPGIYPIGKYYKVCSMEMLGGMN